MKKKTVLVLIIMVVSLLFGCVWHEEPAGTTEITEISVENIIPETAGKDISEDKKGYGAIKYRTYADSDMERLNVSKKLVVVCNYRSAALPETVTGRLNELLVNKHGCDFVVEFIGFESTADSLKYDYEEAIYDIKNSGGQADLIFAGSGKKVNYSTLIEEGFLMDLTEFLMGTKDGMEIYNALPEKLWECLLRDGKIYGVASNVSDYSQNVLVCNKALAKKLGLEVKEGFSFYEMGEMLESVEQELNAEGIIGCYVLQSALAPVLGFYEITDLDLSGCGVYAEQDNEGEWHAYNPLEDERFVELCRLIRIFKEKGWYLCRGTSNVYEKDRLAREQILFYIDYISPEDYVAENLINFSNSLNFSEKTLEIVTGVRNSGYLREKEIGVTGIASWSQYKDEALTLLRLFTTDAEICNLLKYGIEGEDYLYEDGSVQVLKSGIRKGGMGQRTDMLNELLMYTVNEEYAKEMLAESQKGPLLRYGISWEEYSDVAKDYEALHDIYEDYYNGLLCGEFEDVDAIVKEALERQQKAGINSFLDIINNMFKGAVEDGGQN